VVLNQVWSTDVERILCEGSRLLMVYNFILFWNVICSVKIRYSETVSSRADEDTRLQEFLHYSNIIASDRTFWKWLAGETST